jgi:hypothetical protein
VSENLFPVDWARLAAAMKFYEGLGYRVVEVPWWVPRSVSSITCPDPAPVMSIPGIGDLVGSAEQSFLHMQGQDSLAAGRFVACTPCFRNEPRVDALHRKRFMKVELYVNADVGRRALESLFSDAWAFMRTQVGFASDLHRVPTEEGWDIELGTVEVGSYGLRTHGTHVWAYGTGVAEPRFSTALAALA